MMGSQETIPDDTLYPVCTDNAQSAAITDYARNIKAVCYLEIISIIQLQG